MSTTDHTTIRAERDAAREEVRRLREIMGRLGAELTEAVAPIEMFAFGALPFAKVTHVVSVAHGTAHHVAWTLEQLSQQGAKIATGS